MIQVCVNWSRVRVLGALCVMAACFKATPAAAQTITDGRVWYTLTFQGRPAAASRWRWNGDVILRSRDGLDALDVLTLRAVLVHDVTPRLTLGGGYTNAHTYLAAGGSRLEHRPFAHLSWTHPSGAGSLSMRTRFEARISDVNDGTAWRVRHQMRYSHPLAAGSHLSWIGWDEFFLHVNTTALYGRGFDQNRAFAGVGIATIPKLRLEMGYLNQFVRSSTPRRLNHILSASTTVTF
jgi:Protein of unknown function (DUF2490)